MQNQTSEARNVSNSDEIDITEVFSAISRFLIKALSWLRTVTKKYFWLLLILTILGAFAGYYHYKSHQPTYSTALLLYSNHYPEVLLESALEQLNHLIEENNYNSLGQRLKISPHQASLLHSVSFEPIISKLEFVEVATALNAMQSNGQPQAKPDYSEQNLLLQRNYLLEGSNTYKVIAELSDKSIIQDLEAGILYYLLNEEHVKQRAKHKAEYLMTLQTRLQLELKKLNKVDSIYSSWISSLNPADSKSSEILLLVTATGNNVSGAPGLQSFILHRQLLEINESLADNSVVELIHGFNYAKELNKPSLIKRLILGAFLGYAIAFCIVLLITLNTTLKNF